MYYYFAKWRDDGTDQAIHDLLRRQTREKRGGLADPSLVVLDTQSARTVRARTIVISVMLSTRPWRSPPLST